MIRLCCLLGLILALISCKTTRQEIGKPQIRIGVIGSFSGEYAQISGDPLRNSAKLITDSINSTGGILINGQKYEITLFFEDDEDNPQVAVNKAQKLINQDSVAVIVGLTKSRLALPVAVLADSLHIPMITSMSTNPEITNNKRFVFRATFTDPVQSTVLANFAYNELKLHKAAVLYDIASSFNKGLAELFKARFEEFGGEIVAFETFVTGDSIFTRQLQKIKNSRAELLFLPNYNTEIARQARQADKLKMKMPLLGADSWVPLNQEDLAFLNGGFYSTDYSIASENQENLAFVKLYQQKYAIKPTRSAALAYDVFGLLFTALRKCPEPTAENIRLSLLTVNNYAGVSGIISFNGKCDPERSMVIMQIKDNKTEFYKQINPE